MANVGTPTEATSEDRLLATIPPGTSDEAVSISTQRTPLDEARKGRTITARTQWALLLTHHDSRRLHRDPDGNPLEDSESVVETEIPP